MERYMADLVNATRAPAEFGSDLPRWIEVGASPRASLALDRCGRTHAWMQGRDYVDPEDVRAIAPDVLRHRLKLSYEAQGEGVAPDRVVAEIIKQVALP
jgi:MoxR-like ATPase